MNHALCQNFTPAAAAKAAFLWRNTRCLCLKIILFCIIEQDKTARSGVSGPTSPWMVNSNNSAELLNHCIEYIPLFLAPLWLWCLWMLAASVLSLSLLSAVDSAVDSAAAAAAAALLQTSHATSLLPTLLLKSTALHTNRLAESYWDPAVQDLGACNVSYNHKTCSGSSGSSSWAVWRASSSTQRNQACTYMQRYVPRKAAALQLFQVVTLKATNLFNLNKNYCHSDFISDFISERPDWKVTSMKLGLNEKQLSPNTLVHRIENITALKNNYSSNNAKSLVSPLRKPCPASTHLLPLSSFLPTSKQVNAYISCPDTLFSVLSINMNKCRGRVLPSSELTF